jgi:hypothetical protein
MPKKMYCVRHITPGQKPSKVRYFTKKEALDCVEWWKNHPDQAAIANHRVVYAGVEFVNEDGSTKRNKK